MEKEPNKCHLSQFVSKPVHRYNAYQFLEAKEERKVL